MANVCLAFDVWVDWTTVYSCQWLQIPLFIQAEQYAVPGPSPATKRGDVTTDEEPGKEERGLLVEDDQMQAAATQTKFTYVPVLLY